MDFDSNPYAETDEEREKRLLEEFRAAEQAARDRKVKEGIDTTNAALEKTGSQHRLPDDVVAAQQRFQEKGGVNQDVRPLPPAATKAMADTDRALEMTGSKYRLPDVEIEQGAPEANPYRETVGQREFNPKASTKQLRSELAVGQNDALDYVTEKGDIQGRGLERQAELAGELAEQRKQGMSEAQQRVDQSRSVREAMQREAYQRLDKISAMVDHPPDQSRGKVLQIIGAVMGASGKGGAIGAGLQMLGRSMAGDVQGWATEIDANRGALQSMFGAIESQEKGEEHELRMQKAYADLGFGVYEASLAQAQAEAKSEEARAVAGELRNGLRAKYAETQIDFNERQAALAKKAGAGAANKERERQILDYLSSLPLEQRSDAAMKIGPDAVALWKGAQHNISTDVDMAKKAADAEKALREEATGGQKMTDGDKKLARIAAGARPAYDALADRAQLLAAGKWDVPYIGIGPGATQMLADEDTQNVNSDIMKLANVLLRDESGANLPDSEQKTMWASWGLTSPDQAVRNRGYAKMLAEYEGRTQQVAPVTTSGPSRSAAPPKAGGGGTVRLVKGDVVKDVPPDMVDAYRAHGFRPEDQRVGSTGEW